MSVCFQWCVDDRDEPPASSVGCNGCDYGNDGGAYLGRSVFRPIFGCLMQGVQTPSDLDLLPPTYSAGLRQMRNPQHAGAGRIDSPNCLTLIALRPARCGISVSAANRTIRLASGAGLGSGAVLLVSYCSFRFHFNFPTAGFVDLLIVVVTALNSASLRLQVLRWRDDVSPPT